MVTRPQTLAEADLKAMADYLVSGYWRTVENRGPFNFDTSAGPGITVNLTGLTATGQALARGALEAWEMVANVEFREVTRGGQIRFDDKGASGNTGFSFGGPTGLIGASVNIGTGWLDKYGTIVGSFSFHSYIHEIGHALGLGHAGRYDSTIPTWPSGRVFDQDSWQRTVMSYYGQNANPNVDASRAAVIAPQMADILAMQAIYGAASGGATAGKTVWGVGSTLDNYLGRYFRDGYVEGVPLPYAATFTIFDEGGIDTLDLSHHGADQRVSLAPGSINDVLGLVGNLMIMPGTLIEHFNAGRGDDAIWGNTLANRISAGLGNDSVWGEDGDDRIDGGWGDDRLEGGAGNDSLLGDYGIDKMIGGLGDDRMDGGLAADDLSGGAGNDRLWGDAGEDVLSGGDGNDEMDGGAQNDALAGGGGNDRLLGDLGDDRLNGGGGDDWMAGGKGSDRYEGGTGADRFVFEGGSDVITDFGRGDRLVFDPALARDGTLTAAEALAFLTKTPQGLLFDLGGRGSLLLSGITDTEVLTGRIDIL